MNQKDLSEGFQILWVDSGAAIVTEDEYLSDEEEENGSLYKEKQ